MIKATASFKDNLQLLPSIAGLSRIDLIDLAGRVAGSIANEPGKTGSLAVYQYLSQNFASLDVDAAQHGLALFAEHTADAKIGQVFIPILIGCWTLQGGRPR